MTFSTAIDKYLEWGKHHYSSRTVELYVDHLRRFSSFIDNKKIGSISFYDDINQYIQHLKKKNIADNTINLSMIALRQMWKTLAALEKELKIELPFLWNIIPVRGGISAKSHKPVTIEQFNKILSGIDGKGTFIYVRDAAIFRLLYDTGIRVSELTNMDTSSLNTEDQSAVVITRKRRDSVKHRQVFYTRETAKALLTYLDIRKHYTGSTALFVNLVHGKRLTTRSIERSLKGYCQLVGIDPSLVKPHSFRHGWGMRAVEAEMYPPYVQAGLGHANLNSSQIYYNVRNKALQKEYHLKMGDKKVELMSGV